MIEIGNVLSLFDGCSVFQQALQVAEVKYGTYYASEIEKQPMVATQYNFPNTIQLGDVCKVSGYDLPKISIVVFGFPCQSHSIAGKGLGFADPRGQLFFEAVRIIKECRTKNPGLLFIAENVKMSKQSLKVISEDLGVYPQLINSALLTAQNRERNYWSNICTEKVGFFDEIYTSFPTPKDKGILLKDILQPMEEVAEKYYLSDRVVDNLIKYKEKEKGNGFTAKFHEDDGKMSSLKVGGGGCDDLIKVKDINGKNSCLDANYGKGDNRPGNKSGRTLIQQPIQTDTLYDNNAQAGRIYSEEGKSVTINANGGKTGLYEVGCIKFGRTEEAKAIRKENMKKGNDTTPFADKEITGLDFEKMNTLTCAASKDNLLLERGVKQINESKESGGKQPYQQNRVYDVDGISPALCKDKSDLLIQQIGLNANQQLKFDENPDTDKANCLTEAQGRAGSSSEYMDSVSKVAKLTGRIRRLTPIECCRLQGISDTYFYDNEGKNIISDSAIYKAVGNSFTRDVFVHFLKYLPKQKTNN